jgi:hypothetical protein
VLVTDRSVVSVDLEPMKEKVDDEILNKVG